MRALTMIAAGAAMLLGAAAPAQQGPALAPASIEVAAAPRAAAPASTGSRPLDKVDVDAWLDGFMPYALGTGDIAGAVVVVVKDGQVLTQRGFGFADVASKKKVDPDLTLFRPGSVSKLIAWTAVMQQVEQGRIDLDADINTYLDFTIPARDGKPITMRQMMTHTAGFEDHAKGLIFYDASRLTSLGDYLKSWVPNRIFAPGTTQAYSNYATALAGYVVERVAKMSFDDYVDRHIFAPLGMKNSTFRQPLPAHLASHMSSGYKLGSGEAGKFEVVAPGPAGSMSSTGADMARFMIAHLQGGELGGNRILSAETTRLMHDTPTTLLPPLNRMRLGFFETNVNGQQVIAHLGDTQQFHSALHLFVDQGVGIYLSVNSMGRNGAAGNVRTALFHEFADRYFPGNVKDGLVPAATAAEHARLMAGNWTNTRRIDTGFFRALGLAGQIKIVVNDKGEMVIPSLTGADGAPYKWVEVEPFVWRAVNGKERIGAKVVDGKVVRWSMDSFASVMAFDPVPASKSGAWLVPLTLASLSILLFTFLHWPVSALVRRHYKASLALTGRSRSTYRGVRLFSGLAAAVLLGWMVTIPAMMSDLARLAGGFDGLLWGLQIAGLVAFFGAVVMAGLNLSIAFREKRGWASKLWSVLVLIAALSILYVAFTFGLLDMTVDF